MSMPRTSKLALMRASLVQSKLKIAMSAEPGTLAPPPTPQALPAVEDQLLEDAVLPPAEPTQ